MAAGRILVIGGGISGLAAAFELTQRGVTDLEVWEAGADPGGVIRSEAIDGFLCEHAANGTLASADGAREIADKLGVPLVGASPAAKKRWIWRHGALQPLPSSPPALFKSRLLSWRGKLRLLSEPLWSRGTQADESVAAFGRRRLGQEATYALLDPFLTGVFAGDIERLSMPAALPKIAQLERSHRSLFLGMLRQRKQGDPVSSLAAPREGMGALPAALARALGDRVKTGRRVEALERQGASWRVIAGAQTTVADRLVLALPAAEAAQLVRPHDAALADAMAAVEQVPAVIVHCALRRDKVPHPLDGFGFLVARDESLRCLGCVFESVVWPGRAPDGQVLIRLIYGGARDPQIIEVTDDALATVAASDLREALGVTDAPRVLRIVRWPRAIVQYTVGHLARVEEMETRAAPLGMVLAGSGYRGVAVNDCIAQRRRVADQLLG